MGGKVFKSNIRLKYNYSSGKVGNTVFRPYVYDSSGTSDTLSDAFLRTDMVHPLNTLSDDYKLRYNIGNKDDYPGGRRYFLFFKGTNGVNSMFSASNDSLVSDIDKNRDVHIPTDKQYLNSYIINKHGLVFDKGTLKYKDKYNNIYTVEGLGGYSPEGVNGIISRGTTLFGYGQPTRHDSFIIGSGSYHSDIRPNDSRFENNGYSCFMLIVYFTVRLSHSHGASGNFTMYCFVPVCFYDLWVLNNGGNINNNRWYLGTDTTRGRYAYSTSLYLRNTINGFGARGDSHVWGYNGINLSSGNFTNNVELARTIPDVYWTSPNGDFGSDGNFIPPNIYNDYSSNVGFRCTVAIGYTAYHMSEMSYKYYMYGEGQSYWRGKEGNMDRYMVKWYPTIDVESAQPDYFSEHYYVY